MVKRIMGLILTVTMIMSLLACGKADTDTSKTTQSDSNSSEDDVITFTFAEHVADIENQAPQVYAVVQEFMKQNPDIKIEMTGAAQDEHTKKIKLASQSDSLHHSAIVIYCGITSGETISGKWSCAVHDLCPECNCTNISRSDLVVYSGSENGDD